MTRSRPHCWATLSQVSYLDLSESRAFPLKPCALLPLGNDNCSTYAACAKGKEGIWMTIRQWREKQSFRKSVRWEFRKIIREIRKILSTNFCNSKPSFNVWEIHCSHLLNGNAIPWSLTVNMKCYVSKRELENLKEAQYTQDSFWSVLPMWYTTLNAIKKCSGTVVPFSWIHQHNLPL